MARTKGPRYTVKQSLGMDITDFMDLSGRELRAATKALTDAANKRLTRIRKSGIKSPAAMEVWSSGGKFGIAGKSEGQLRTEFLRARQFIEAPTSTVSGAKAARKRTQAGLRSEGLSIDDELYNKLIQAYIDNINTNPAIQARTIKYMLRDNAESWTASTELDIEDIAQRIRDEIDSQYNPGGSQYDGAARYFDLDEDL